MTPERSFAVLDRSQHDRGGFASGEAELDQFLQQQALRHMQAGISRTMVLSEARPEHPNAGKASICAYYTLSHTTMEREHLPAAQAKKLPRYPVPVLLVAQLAVHSNWQGQGLGKVSLVCALRQCLQIEAHLPSHAIVVDALDDSRIAFYEHFGFKRLDANSVRTRLFLPMKTARQALSV